MHLLSSPHHFPGKLRRVQAGLHCAVSYLFQYPMRESLLLILATSITTGDPLGQGYAYREGGWRAGDTATIVIPYTKCHCTTILGMSYGAVPIPPAPPLQLDVR